MTIPVYSCEWCAAEKATEEHHIAQGVDRKAAGHNPSCVIYLCHECHTKIQGIRDTRMIGLAILGTRRPCDFNLPEFYRVTKRNWPDSRDVKRWELRLNMDRGTR